MVNYCISCELDLVPNVSVIHMPSLLPAQNELLPASDRLPAHTKKKPSGPFDRKHLLSHLTEQAEKSTVGHDYVPFVKKEKKEKPNEKQKVCQNNAIYIVRG